MTAGISLRVIGLICQDAARLLQNANRLVTAHSSAVAEMHGWVQDRIEKGLPSDPEEFARMTDEVEASRNAAQEAWDIYRKHLEQHGC